MANISKVTFDGVIYDIKDTNARNRLTTLEGIISGGIEIVVVSTLPTASKDTVGKIYFISHQHATGDSYDEYLTLIGGTQAAPTYSWEKIGNTDIDLSGYAKNNHTHTVTSNVTASKKKITPAGTITLPSFTSTVTPSTDKNVAKVTNVGTAYSLSGGSVTKGNDSKSSFATEGLKATYNEADETLTFTTASTASAVTASGSVSYTKPVLSGSLPTFSTVEVMTGVTVATAANGAATFAGTEVDVTPTLTNNAVTSGVNVNPS